MDLGGFKEPHLVLVQSSYPGDEHLHPYSLSSCEVIKETQLFSHYDRGKAYNDILASIGLDSPTPSHEARLEEGHIRIEQGLESHIVSMPMGNNETSLITLGQQAPPPRQGRSWTYTSNSLLGGKAI